MILAVDNWSHSHTWRFDPLTSIHTHANASGRKCPSEVIILRSKVDVWWTLTCKFVSRECMIPIEDQNFTEWPLGTEMNKMKELLEFLEFWSTLVELSLVKSWENQKRTAAISVLDIPIISNFQMPLMLEYYSSVFPVKALNETEFKYKYPYIYLNPDRSRLPSNVQSLSDEIFSCILMSKQETRLAYF